MSINLAVSYLHPAAIATRVSYARIDNTSTPVFTTVPNLVGASGTFVIAQNIPAGQYQINGVPIYADGRTCPPTIQITPACPGLTSISAFITGSVIVISYLAPPTAPKVRITVNYPNGGSNTANYVNDGNPISLALPSGVFGNYSVSGQSVCDESSGFYSQPSGIVNVTYNQAISSSYQIGTTSILACAASAGSLFTNGVFGPGVGLFYDSALTNPVTGNSFVVNIANGHIFNLSPVTGIIGSDTGNTCGTTTNVFIQNINSNYFIPAVLGIPGFSLIGTVFSGGSQTGTHGAFIGVIQVPIAGIDGPCCIGLLVNNIPIQSVSVASSGLITFSSISVSATDKISIILHQGSCP